MTDRATMLEGHWLDMPVEALPPQVGDYLEPELIPDFLLAGGQVASKYATWEVRNGELWVITNGDAKRAVANRWSDPDFWGSPRKVTRSVSTVIPVSG